MIYEIAYDKKKTIHALRLHFAARWEIKAMVIAVNVFALVSVALFYMKLVRPAPFFIGTLAWTLLMVGVWFVLPMTVYARSELLRSTFQVNLGQQGVTLWNRSGETFWGWDRFVYRIETPFFHHLYFDERTFFLLPKPPEAAAATNAEAILSAVPKKG